MLLSIVGAAIFQACGNTRTPFLISLVANAVNFVVNYILIFGNYGAPELGVRGAAIGSAIAIAINATVLLFILTRNNSLINLRGYGGEWAALIIPLSLSSVPSR